MVFSMMMIMRAGGSPQFQFTFDAADQEQASRKATAWRRYHGLTPAD